MKAIQVNEFGGPETMRLADVPGPEIGDDEMLIDVAAASVNRVDILLRSGKYHRTPPLPFVPGAEGSGTVVAVSPSAQGFRPGDRVVALGGRPGFYAEQVVTSVDQAVRVPEGLDVALAGSMPIVWLSAWYCLRHLVRITAKDTVVIHAAASGVGDAAVQIAKLVGSRVIATAGSDDKVAWARSNGADWGINYTRQDFVAETNEITGGRGVDVVLDLVGAGTFAASLKVLAHGARVAAMANVTMEDSLINTRDFYPKNAVIYGFQITNLVEHGGYDPRPDLTELLKLAAAGRIQVRIDRWFPLAEAPDAHRYLEDRRNRGKVVLIPRGSRPQCAGQPL